MKKRICIYFKGDLFINKLKPAINTHYCNFNNTLKLNSNTLKNLSRKQYTIVNESENEIENYVYSTRLYYFIYST